MKFKVMLFILIVFILTGCGKNDLECKKTFEGKAKYTVKVIASVDSKTKRITSSTAKMTFKDYGESKGFCELNKMLNNEKVTIVCSGNQVIINNYHYIEIDSGDTITKDELKNRLIDQGFKCN